jgi:Flp pilus assembly protein TadG
LSVPRPRWTSAGDERGALSLELAVLAGAGLAVAGLALYAGRAAMAHQVVDNAAGAAARAASLADNSGAAQAAGAQAAQAALAGHLTCRNTATQVSTAGYGPGSTVRALVSCTASRGWLMPGTLTVSSSAGALVDPYRAVSGGLSNSGGPTASNGKVGGG